MFQTIFRSPFSLRPWQHFPVAIALLGALTLGCSSDDDDSNDGTAGDGDGDGSGDGDGDGDGGTDEMTFDAQVARGMALYGTHCAHCHGDSGQGTDDGPLVVGDGRLPKDPPDDRMFRENQFVTALDVFTFANPNMPGDDPGSLSDAEMVDILAFALFANGVMLDEPLSGDNAADVVINPD